MSKVSKGLLLCALAGSCAVLCGCQSELGNTPTILDNQADYSVNISLPYATVAAESDETESVEALEISTDGKVKVNDSKAVLSEGDSDSKGSSNYKSLRQGNTGLAVQVLQSRLAELGYFSAGVSGVFDSETEAAVRRFEQTYGTMQTGVATADLQARLFAPDAIAYGTDAYNSAVVSQYRLLQEGDSGSSVYALQQRLRTLGYPITNLTGTFDEETAHAVGLFYEAYNLKYSEVANVAMQQELYSDSAKVYGDGVTVSTVDVPEETESSNFVNVTLNNVLELQERLIGLGYMTGKATGENDSNTSVAVSLLQEACGEPVTGEATDNVINLLNREDVPSFNDVYGKYGNLLEGSGGDEVRALQERLIALGFVTGLPNGEYGSATTAAMVLFQRANGLDETGIATAHDQAVIFSSFVRNIDGEQIFKDQAPVVSAITEQDEVNTQVSVVDASGAGMSATRLMVGSSGDDVLNLQYRLTDLGYVSSITATFDSITERAIQAFQKNIGVEATGIVSPTLHVFIYSDAAPNAATAYFGETQNYRQLSMNDTGDDVEALQKVLWKLGYLDQNAVTVGTYDQTTYNAVTGVQSALNYNVLDGVAGPELQCYLNSEYADSIKK